MNWQSTIQEIGKSLDKTTFVIVDLETTGGAPHLGAAITEIGAVKVCGGVVLSEFSTFVNPGHPIPSYITNLTGITDLMVEGAPTIEALIPDFMSFMGDKDETVFVAQNAPFDLSFIKYYLSVHKYAWPGFPIIDTATLARKVLSRDEVPNCKLGTLAAFFGTDTTPNHRALDDARATNEVLHGLIERLSGFDIYTLEELLAFGKKATSGRSREKSPEKDQPIS
ncbi:DnaQ DNA polymerase III, epsilon subunit and related 3'-5' exonucleases [Candidatus Nanopelagicaceae bacterium]